MNQQQNQSLLKNSGGRNHYGAGMNKQYILLLLGDLIFAFINWSLFVEFISVIWFFPMGFMGFTGWEAALVAVFSPIFLGIGAVDRLVGRFNLFIRVVAQCIGLLSLIPYGPIDKTLIKDDEFLSHPHMKKTALIAIAVGLDWLCQCQRFTSIKTASRRERGAFAYALAIVLHAIIRIPYLSVNPFMTWTNWIVFGVILSVVAFIILLTGDNNTDDKKNSALWSIEHNDESSSPLYTGIGFGGIVFCNQLLFSTYGLIPRWVDLNPFPYGIFVVFFMMVGVVLSKKRSLITSRNYFLFALFLSVVFGLCSGSVSGIVGFIGLISGSLLGVYVNSQWIVIVEKLSHCEKLGRLFITSTLTYVVLLFWAIYVVSYKFVPWWLGSTLLRERNQTMIIANIICVGIGALSLKVSNVGINNKKEKSKETTYPNKDVWNVLFGLTVLLLLFSVNRAITHPTDASVAGHHYERTLTTESVSLAAPTEIKSMIWTIHFGYDNFGRNSFPNVTEAIRSHGANVIGILESDLSRVMTANRDLVEWLATELHMYSDFGPAPSENTWGCALLTIFPIQSSKHVILPSPEGELACLIDAIVLVDNTPVNIIVTHFGNTEDKLDRELQAAGAAEIVATNAMPTVFLSYITEKTNGPNYKTLMASGLSDTTTERRYCEYIFYRQLELTSFRRWGCGDISDTEAQLANFKVLPKSSNNQQQQQQQ
ncbi:hypothetical protein CYY_001149 [Polysphondylium violaceum]|uniref:Transmembrane protein n=1 Tax=Polysphondylium violaceum TaxID=133409 RepID=A0A8J4Q9Q4_9MYCE|nr:hypothetical protein CYY_001149 [Polysphondylium violaceum]